MNKKIRVLIIDENKEDILLINSVLSYEFSNVETVQVLNDNDFNKALNEGDFNIVVTEYNLSWSDGLKVLHSIKVRYPDIPVIMFTNSCDDEKSKRAKEEGLDDYIIKAPEHYIRLSVAIKNILTKDKSRTGVDYKPDMYQKLFERVPVGLYRTAIDGKILDSNPALLKMLACPDKESLFSINAEEVYIEPDDRNRWKEMMEKNGVVRGFEVQLRRFNGEIIWVRDTAYGVRDNDGNLLYYEGSLEDITERKLAEKALKESENTYHGIYDTTLALAEGVDLGKVIQIIADRATELLFGKDCVVYLLDEDRKVLTPLYSNAKDEREEIMSYEVPLGKGLSGRVAKTGVGAYINFSDLEDFSIHIPDTDSGEDKFESVISVPMFDGDKILGVITVGKHNIKFQDSDIKKLTIFARQAEIAIKRARDVEDLKESEEKYRILVEESHDAIFIYSDDKLLFVNDRVCEITGYSKEELYSMDIWRLIHHEDVKRLKEIAVRREKGESVPNTYEARIITKNGEVRIGEWAVDTIKFRGNYAVLGMIRDVTDFKEMEDEIQKAEKLDSIGILAGGIAHDFNNLLTGIMGNISLAKIHMKSNEEVFEILDDAEKASRKAEKLTHQLLTFSKGGAPIKEAASMTDIIKESADFALSGSNVKCEFNFQGDLWMVEVDKGQISQVINNLIINADQAMPEGGVIEVKASNINIKEDNIIPIEPGNYVEISIKDEGVGIPEEQLLNIYDPFFSTKDGGSGLGLTTAYSIIQRHEGYISVESEVGVGSTFYIYLPAVIEKEKLEEEKSDIKSFKKGEKILLMDDEEVIRDVAGRMLKRLGYKVEFASNGAEVITKYKKAYESGDGFDAVIMDLTIPGGMGGRDAITELLSIDPNVKAIVSSGYFNDPVMANFKDYGFSGVVPKPYNTEELEKELKRVFESK
jgi:PAS domain S-box-containing protein